MSNVSSETPSVDENLKAIKALVKANLHLCTLELVEWRRTGVLSDGKVRELAALCEKTFAPGDERAAYGNVGLNTAESFVVDEVLKKAVRDEIEAVADAAHEYECLVPWVNGEPVLNAIGTSEADCRANLSLIDLSELERMNASFHPAVVIHKSPDA